MAGRDRLGGECPTEEDRATEDQEPHHCILPSRAAPPGPPPPESAEGRTGTPGVRQPAEMAWSAAHGVRGGPYRPWLNPRMPVVHHFAHGPIHPIVAYVLAFFGAAISLACAARARRARFRNLRVRWLATGAFSLGSGI